MCVGEAHRTKVEAGAEDDDRSGGVSGGCELVLILATCRSSRILQLYQVPRYLLVGTCIVIS